MINYNSLTINIIYVPGTVQLLLPFFKTLYSHSNCKYRLVSNGCANDEIHELKSAAEMDERLSFYDIDSQKVLPHHDLLNRLLDMETSEYFIFCDSDICANGPFLKDAFDELGEKDAFFSGFPLWHDESEKVMPRKFMVLGGRFPETHNGIIVGFSYFAIYRKNVLQQFMKTHEISFDRYSWTTIPATLKPLLIRNQLKKSFYDTGKLLNALMYLEGYKLSYAKLNALKHLGGISGITTQKNKNKVKHLLFQKRKLISVWARIIMRYMKNFKSRRMSLKESANIDLLVTKRIFTEAYFKVRVDDKGGLTELSQNNISSDLLKDIDEIVSIVSD